MRKAILYDEVNKKKKYGLSASDLESDIIDLNLTPTPPLCPIVNKVNCIWKRFFRTQSMGIVYLNEEE